MSKIKKKDIKGIIEMFNWIKTKELNSLLLHFLKAQIDSGLEKVQKVGFLKF